MLPLDVTIRVIKAGDIYRVEGPAKVVVRSGQIYATGVIYAEGQSFTVLRARRLAIKAVTDAEVEFVLGPGALLEKAAPGEEVIDEWERHLSALDPRGVVLIIGAINVGKSTVAAILGNKALSRGYKAAIIDADVGQMELGPPTTVSLARLTRYVTHLRQLVAEKSFFLQATSLEGIWPRALEKIVKAVEYVKNRWQVDTVVVNTEGWVLEEEAVVFKRQLIMQLQPTVIVAIQVENELVPILNGFGNVVVLPPPPYAKKRTREDRKIHREMGYGRYIFPPVELALPLDKIPLCNLPLFRGVEMDEELRRMLTKAIGMPVLRAYQAGSRVYAIVGGDVWATKKVGGFQVFCLPQDFEKGLLVGLEDREGFLVGLGVLKKIYYDKRRAVIYTSRDVEKRLGEVTCMRLGFVRLDDGFNEVEKVVGLLRAET
jgi:polynucleotide 5'-hydroxyl-kinase GRC3/NOL9